MSSPAIICATTESTSRKSKKGTITGIKKIFSRFEFLSGPSGHTERTPKKHVMALSQAILAKKTHVNVMLIMLVPENYHYPHMLEIGKKAMEAGVEFTTCSPDEFKFVIEMVEYRNQRNSYPDCVE